ncbi:MAG: hypothetical protein B6247_31830 [Candidatus Parabeggiatoa sp. nov. 2]|nr:MAG: hypothetical protein B6247_31830 [Beggiatoa sp. 4572_84]
MNGSSTLKQYANEAQKRLQALETAEAERAADKNSWQMARQLDTPSAYQAYLNGDTLKQYADDAKQQLQALEKAEADERAADSLANGPSTAHSVGLPSLPRRRHPQTIRHRGPKTITSPRKCRG